MVLFPQIRSQRHTVQGIPKKNVVSSINVVIVIQGIREAHALDDYPRVKYLQDDLCELSSRLSLPLQTVGSICVANITPHQKTLIHTVVRRIVKQCTVPVPITEGCTH